METTPPSAGLPTAARTGPALLALAVAETMQLLGHYGFRTLLVWFLVDRARGLSWDMESARSVHGSFVTASLLAPLFLAILADKLIGQRRAVMLGMLMMGLGPIVLIGLPSVGLYPALVLMVVGSGLVRPALYSVVGGLYRREDHRRDGAFTLMLIPIAVGGFAGPMLCGAVHARWGWEAAFAVAAVAVTVGMVVLWFSREGLRGHLWQRSEFAEEPNGPLNADARRDDHKNLLTVGVLVGVFVTLLSLAAKGLTEANAQPSVESSLASLAPQLLALLFAPFLASLWTHWGSTGRDPSPLLKLSVGMALWAVGLLVVPAGKALFESDPGLQRVATLLGVVCQAVGSVCVIPIALSHATRLAPARYIATCVAGWLLFTSVAPGFVAGRMGDAVLGHGVAVALPLIVVALVPAVILFLLARRTVRLAD